MSIYNLIQTICQVAVILILVLTVWKYHQQLQVFSQQLKAMKDGVQSQNLLSIVQFLQEPEIRKARENVIRKLKTKSYANWTDSDKKEASIVCSSYGTAGGLLKSELANSDLILEGYGPSITICFHILEEFIKEKRKEAGQNFWINFDWLYQKTIERYPPSGGTMMSNGDEIAELEGLRKHEDELISARANIFLVAHTLLVAAVTLSSLSAAKVAISILGVVLSLLWTSIGIRHRSLMNWYSDKIIDNKLGSISKIQIELRAWKKKDIWYRIGGQNIGFRVLTIMCIWLPVSFSAFWVFMLILVTSNQPE